jgi:hypothetical protein
MNGLMNRFNIVIVLLLLAPFAAAGDGVGRDFCTEPTYEDLKLSLDGRLYPPGTRVDLYTMESAASRVGHLAVRGSKVVAVDRGTVTVRLSVSDARKVKRRPQGHMIFLAFSSIK